MRAIHVAQVGTTSRPVLVLTRDYMRTRLTNVTVAPITSTIRGLPIEVPVGARNGLDRDSAVNCDNVVTIAVADLGHAIGYLPDEQEDALTKAIAHAFDLR